MSDRSIFGFHAKAYRAALGQDIKPMTVWAFTGQTGYAPIFRSEQIRDDDNAGLKHLLQTGRYDANIRGYAE